MPCPGGIDESTREIPALLDDAVHRRAVRMHVEHVHEHAQLQGLALHVWIVRAAHLDDAAIGRDSTARGSSGTSRGGIAEELQDEQRKQPERKSTTSPKNQVTAAAARREPKTNGHPSRAMIGCGYGGLTRYFGSSSFRRSEPCPCCIALPTSVVTRSTIFSAVGRGAWRPRTQGSCRRSGEEEPLQ